MKPRVPLTATLVVLGTLVFSTLANGQTTSAGPYYATPSWDQTLACTTLTTCPRFIVLSNMNSDAVLDRETGLVWEKSPSTEGVTWFIAQDHCNELSKGNRMGWRLPTLQELASLFDPSVAFNELALPAGHPFENVQTSTTYWSATTTVGNNATVAWNVPFVGGAGPGSASKGFFSFLVWCVRGGQGVDPQ